MIGPSEERRRLDRTWLCSVVFVDLVGYSVQSVEVQMGWKDRLNRLLAEAIVDVHEDDRVILDTGDGAAVCFLGDPEAAMLGAQRLQAGLLREEPREVAMRARIGVHLGPVKLVRDLNGNLNALGDGINAGQRVMSFAAENQVLVSRSFFEVVSCLSDRYVERFAFAGVRRDKHDREHTLYEFHPHAAPPAATPAAAVAGALDPAVLERAERYLTPLVGPIAHELVRRAGATAVTSADLCRALEEHVPGVEGRRRLAEACAAGRSPAPTPAPRLEQAVLDRATRALAVHVGPLARVLVDRAAARVQSEHDLHQLLASEIGPPEERARYLSAIRSSGRGSR